LPIRPGHDERGVHQPSDAHPNARLWPLPERSAVTASVTQTAVAERRIGCDEVAQTTGNIQETKAYARRARHRRNVAI